MNLAELFVSPIFLKFRKEREFMKEVPDLNFLCTLFDEIALHVSKKSSPSRMNFPVVLTALDEKGYFLSLSTATLPVLGYNWIDLMKKHSSVLFSQEQESSFMNVLSQKKSCKFKTRLVKKDLTTLETLWTLAWSNENHCFLGTIQPFDLDLTITESFPIPIAGNDLP